jgi:hypothetical protein
MTNLTRGCIVRWTESVFAGTYPGRRFVGDRTVVGEIVKDSYGKKRGQHTFTIEVSASTGCQPVKIGKKITRRGRNIYPQCKILSYPENYRELADEKNERKKSAFKHVDDTHFGNVLGGRDDLVSPLFINRNINTLGLRLSGPERRKLKKIRDKNDAD